VFRRATSKPDDFNRGYVRIVGSSYSSTALLGIVTAMTAIFVGLMMLAAFLQYESKEYIGTFISVAIGLFAMSLPYWLPQTMEGKKKEEGK